MKGRRGGQTRACSEAAPREANQGLRDEGAGNCSQPSASARALLLRTAQPPLTLRLCVGHAGGGPLLAGQRGPLQHVGKVGGVAACVWAGKRGKAEW